ncbi:uncharacterized protein LOC141854865 isoform X1 [Brevipalpus obovatus]|uniref:uncharacterized protein LOC141854865 isoform X1 n=1 Tax=Brevipalpus obovatus TaxID=246614 RepID=UPI003D9F9C29
MNPSSLRGKYLILPHQLLSLHFFLSDVHSLGHKRHCRYRDCLCLKCEETKKRQEYMADMQYIKRNGKAEEARLGKRADMIAIFNERMKNKQSKKKITETEGTEMAKRDKNPEQSASFEFTDSNMPEIQDMLRYFRNELDITDEDDILYHSLVALLQDMDQSDTKPIHEYILNVYRGLN